MVSRDNFLAPKPLGVIFYNTRYYFFNTQRASLIHPCTGVEKHYNNHSSAYIAGTQNSTGAYKLIMACLQALVNNLLVHVAKQL